jgi:uncharacterized repeat protein (TIGR02059 family)
MAASLFSQGANTISILETDVAGNTVTNSFTYTLDTQPPNVAITSTLMGDNRINSSEVSSVIASGTVGAVTSDVGDTVSVTYSDGTHSASTTAIVSSSYTWQTSGLNLTTFNQGNVTVSASVTDVAGNVSSLATKTLVIDTVVPNIDSAQVAGNTLQISLTEIGSGLYSGTAPNTTDFTVKVDGTTTTITSVSLDTVSNYINLTLGVSVDPRSTVTLSYNGASDSHAIQDNAGNLAATVSNLSVTNVSNDTVAPSAPTLSLVQSDTGLKGDNLTNTTSPYIHVALNELGDPTDPKAGDTVTLYDASGSSIASYTLTSTDITNKYAEVLTDLGSVGNKAVKGTITDFSHNVSSMSSLYSFSIDNSKPQLISASATSSNISLTFASLETGLLPGMAPPSTSSFQVNYNGSVNQVQSVSVNTASQVITLGVATPMVSGNNLNVVYTESSGNDILNPGGNAANSFTTGNISIQSLAWINYQNFLNSQNLMSGGTIAPSTNSLIAIAPVNVVSSAPIVNSNMNVSVGVLDKSAAPSDPNYTTLPAATVTSGGSSYQVTTNWDPIQFDVTPVTPSSDSLGTQTVFIDISKAEVSATTGFNAYMKYLSASTIQAYLDAHVALTTLDGVSITNIAQAGWYDFTQRQNASGNYVGNGARFIKSGGIITGILITLTDNAFGDDNPNLGTIHDPGVPVIEALISSIRSGTEFRPLPTTPAFERESQENRVSSLIETHEVYESLMFIDPQKNLTAAVVHQAVIDNRDLNYLDVMTQSADEYYHKNKERSSWDTKIKNDGHELHTPNNQDRILIGRLSKEKIENVESLDGSPLPDFISFDQKGHVYIAKHVQSHLSIIVKVTVIDALGHKHIIYQEIRNQGVYSSNRKLDEGALSHLWTNTFSPALIFDRSISQEETWPSHDFVSEKTKLALTKKTKMHFKDQLKLAKDDLYWSQAIH